jgi:hypothetical protein
VKDVPPVVDNFSAVGAQLMGHITIKGHQIRRENIMKILYGRWPNHPIFYVPNAIGTNTSLLQVEIRHLQVALYILDITNLISRVSTQSFGIYYYENNCH